MTFDSEQKEADAIIETIKHRLFDVGRDGVRRPTCFAHFYRDAAHEAVSKKGMRESRKIHEYALNQAEQRMERLKEIEGVVA